MTLGIFDHVALEVASLDAEVEQLTATGTLRLIRYGELKRTGQRIAMLGDGTGVKIELIEHPEATTPRFAHLAFRCDDTAATKAALEARNWRGVRGPHRLEEAKADTALLENARGLALQIINYESTSPDVAEWPRDEATDING